MIASVVCAGDTESFLPCNDDHPGGIYSLPAGNMNQILKVRGNAAIVRGQFWQGHCPATAGTRSPSHPVLKVKGVSLCLSGDKSESGCHNSGGIITKQNLLKTIM